MRISKLHAYFGHFQAGISQFYGKLSGVSFQFSGWYKYFVYPYAMREYFSSNFSLHTLLLFPGYINGLNSQCSVPYTPVEFVRDASIVGSGDSRVRRNCKQVNFSSHRFHPSDFLLTDYLPPGSLRMRREQICNGSRRFEA